MLNLFGKKGKRSKTDYLFVMLAIWTSVQFVMIIVEFIKYENFTVPGGMPFGYFMLLLLYIIKKESDRWLKIHWEKRVGEFYLIGWFVAMMIMFIIEFSTDGEYKVPRKLFETIIAIVVAYIGSMSSIIIHYLVTSKNGSGIIKDYFKYREDTKNANSK
ncbi:MAG: hypothetical protein ACNFW9_01985 [Candidatus Kerfeldbacteria bacterium]|jgi:hypothetical protein